MGELIGLCLMPAYAIGCWIGLYKNADTGKHLLPAALFGWIWAIINIMRSKRIDLGVILWFHPRSKMGNQCSGSSRRRKFLIGGGVLEADTKRLVEIEKPIVAQVSAYKNFVRGEPSTSSYSSVNTSLLNVESDDF
eukprot:scaffold5751_cov136-Skeletonema_marinoi.AAC.5